MQSRKQLDPDDKLDSDLERSSQVSTAPSSQRMPFNLVNSKKEKKGLLSKVVGKFFGSKKVEQTAKPSSQLENHSKKYFIFSLLVK